MSRLLVIDSSTEACSAALSDGNKTYSQRQIAPRKHAELLLPMVGELLSEAKLSLSQLEAIACCVGPGAFTGLRIAISMVQGLAFAVNKVCVPVTSLEAIAYQALQQSDSDYCLAAIDARMEQVYFGVYSRSEAFGVELIGELQVIAPESIELDEKLLAKMDNKLILAGNAWQAYNFHPSIQALQGKDSGVTLPDAKSMLYLAQTALKNDKQVSPEDLQPLYLRNNVAKKSKIEL